MRRCENQLVIWVYNTRDYRDSVSGHGGHGKLNREAKRITVRQQGFEDDEGNRRGIWKA